MEAKLFNMYEDPSCDSCSGKGYTTSFGDFGLATGTHRCACSKIGTKDFEEAKESTVITRAEFQKFYDNNSECSSANYCDRSW